MLSIDVLEWNPSDPERAGGASAEAEVGPGSISQSRHQGSISQECSLDCVILPGVRLVLGRPQL